MASADIYEMLEVKLPENVKVILQPGGSGNWKYEKINPNRTQRFVYDQNGVTEVYNAQITSSGRTQTLADFLRFCKTRHTHAPWAGRTHADTSGHARNRPDSHRR